MCSDEDKILFPINISNLAKMSAIEKEEYAVVNISCWHNKTIAKQQKEKQNKKKKQNPINSIKLLLLSRVGGFQHK